MSAKLQAIKDGLWELTTCAGLEETVDQIHVILKLVDELEREMEQELPEEFKVGDVVVYDGYNNGGSPP